MPGRKFNFSKIFLVDVQKRLRQLPELNPAEQGVFEIHLTGTSDGTWTIDATELPPVVTKGSSGHAEVILEMTAADFMDVYEGKMSGLSVFLGGKIGIKGNKSMAMRLGSLISRLF